MAEFEFDTTHTLYHFFLVYELPYIVVTLTYSPVLVLVSAVIAAWRILSLCLCHRENNRCPSCCKKCHNKCSNAVAGFSGWLVKMVFGQSEGFTEGNERGIHSGKKTKDMSINGKHMDNIDVNILGIIIFCFGILVAISAYDTYLLEITHTCSDETAIYCFPGYADAVDPDNPAIPEVLFVVPILNCSFWTKPSIVSKITFTCYRYAFNAKEAIVVAGAMLAFFVISMRIIISVILFVVKFLRNRGCNKCLTGMQVVAVIILLVVDFVVAVIVAVFHLAKELNLFTLLEDDDFPVVQHGAVYVSDHGVQFLIVVGTATLLLLVNWKKYVKVDKDKATMEDGRRHVEGNVDVEEHQMDKVNEKDAEITEKDKINEKDAEVTEKDKVTVKDAEGNAQVWRVTFSISEDS